MKMQKALKMLIVISAASLFQIGILASDDIEMDAWKIKSSEEALTRALVYTGFDSLGEFSVEKGNVVIQLDTNPEVQVPFLYKPSRSDKVWVITFKGVKLPSNRQSIKKEKIQPRTFTVIIEPVNGYLLRIYSKQDGESNHYNPEPPVEVFEEQMLSTRENFLSFPERPPKIDFVNAIQNTRVIHQRATEIIAYYIMQWEMYQDTIPAWSIDLRGLSPGTWIGQNMDKIPPYMRDHQRCVIDARTGSRRVATTIPTTVPPEVLEKRKR
jgi:hypothetical protein